MTESDTALEIVDEINEAEPKESFRDKYFSGPVEIKPINIEKLKKKKKPPKNNKSKILVNIRILF